MLLGKETSCSRLLSPLINLQTDWSTLLREIRWWTWYFNGHLNGADVKTWKTVRLLNCNTSSIPTLTDDLHTAGTSMAKATILNNFLYKCFNKDQPPLSSFQTEFTYISCTPFMWMSDRAPMYRRISSSHADTTRCIQVYRYRWNRQDNAEMCLSSLIQYCSSAQQFI